MKIPTILSSAILLCLAQACSAQTYPSLERVISLSKAQAYRASSVNWADIEKNSSKVAADKSEDQAIWYVLNALGDHHSSYFPLPHGSATETGDNRLSGNSQIGPEQGRPPIAESLSPAAGIPVIAMHSWLGRPNDSIGATNQVRDLLNSARTKNQCGLILDFSTNSGGNMWPMLVGLSPLLSDGEIGGFVDANDVETTIEHKDGRIFVGNKPYFQDLPANRVLYKAIAIILGPRTASSGEITTLMFHGQKNVRTFGSATSGHSTSNKTFILPNGGKLNLTTAATVDRSGNIFTGKIEPDQPESNAIAAAADWANAQCQQ